MKYETCMKYKCKTCPAYIDCDKVEKLESQTILLYKPFENLKEILERKLKEARDKNESFKSSKKLHRQNNRQI
jgi:hypothetical protein